jgi:hypothetical protein
VKLKKEIEAAPCDRDGYIDFGCQLPDLEEFTECIDEFQTFVT